MSPYPPPPEQPVTAPTERPAGVADATRLAEEMRKVPPRAKVGGKTKKPVRGRPPLQPRPALLEEEGPSPREIRAAAEQLRKVSYGVAAVRARRFLAPTEDNVPPEEALLRAYIISDELADIAAVDLALVKDEYMPGLPAWGRLVITLAPWLLGIVVAEIGYYQASRGVRPARPIHPAAGGPAGVQRGPVRPEVERENDPGEVVIGAPFPMPNS